MRSVVSARSRVSAVAVAALAAALFAGPADAAVPAAPLITAIPAAAPADAPTAPAGVLSSVAKGLRGFDTLGAETPAQISCLSSAGYSFDFIDVIGTAKSR